MKRPLQSRRRSGKSLIEMVVAIGLLATLFTSTTTTLYQVIRAEIAARRASDRLSAVSRVAVAFRTDVHVARQIAISDEGQSLTCQHDDGMQVQYVIGTDSVTRTQTVAADQVSRREAFRLLGGTAKFQQADRDGLAVYALQWQVPTPAVTPGLASDVVLIPMEAIARGLAAGR